MINEDWSHYKAFEKSEQLKDIINVQELFLDLFISTYLAIRKNSVQILRQRIIEESQSYRYKKDNIEKFE